MKQLFTIHAGEYLVGSHIEKNFKNPNIWLPSTDTGIDLLVTNQENKKSISIQVKYSKDFLLTHFNQKFQEKLTACGWWTLNKEKIVDSKADYWVFVLQKFNSNKPCFIIIPPQKLINLYKELGRSEKKIQSYIWVTQENYCWESRGLTKAQQLEMISGRGNYRNRSLSKYLNNWAILDKLKD